jgi:hypothetical protein
MDGANVLVAHRDAGSRHPGKEDMTDGTAIWRAMPRREKSFSDPEALWAGAIRYFDWVEANPLYECRPFTYQGELKVERVARMRAMSVAGLRMFLGIGRKAWSDYCASDGFADVTAQIEDVIRIQKLEGAAADLLNASIIQRDLGLGDRKEQVEPPETISDEELDARIAEFFAKAGIGQADGRKEAAGSEKPSGGLPALSEAKGLPRGRR